MRVLLGRLYLSELSDCGLACPDGRDVPLIEHRVIGCSGEGGLRGALDLVEGGESSPEAIGPFAQRAAVTLHEVRDRVAIPGLCLSQRVERFAPRVEGSTVADKTLSWRYVGFIPRQGGNSLRAIRVA